MIDEEIKRLNKLVTMEEERAKFEPLCKLMKDILGNKVEKVALGTCIEKYPCVLVASEHTANMKVQAPRDVNTSSYKVSKNTLKLNAKHQIVDELRKKAEVANSDKTVKDLVWLLYDTSILTSGCSLDEILESRFQRMNELCQKDSESESIEWIRQREAKLKDENRSVPDATKEEDRLMMAAIKKLADE